MLWKSRSGNWVFHSPKSLPCCRFRHIASCNGDQGGQEEELRDTHSFSTLFLCDNNFIVIRWPPRTPLQMNFWGGQKKKKKKPAVAFCPILASKEASYLSYCFHINGFLLSFLSTAIYPFVSPHVHAGCSMYLDLNGVRFLWGCALA